MKPAYNSRYVLSTSFFPHILLRSIAFILITKM